MNKEGNMGNGSSYFMHDEHYFSDNLGSGGVSVGLENSQNYN